ncbi:MAG: WbqC family protein [Bacteroidales bacterium]|jgi:hypothetical protein|nr:WbqC family protein [Bacteroidales bacterium]
MVLLSALYFPPIEYFSILFQNKESCIDLGENYVKQSYRNRCKILTSTGVQNLIVPVKSYGNHTALKEILIDYDMDWQKNHYKSLETAYNKSPFFLYYKDDLQKFFFDKKYKYLHELNLEILDYFCKIFQIKTKLGILEDFVENSEPENDFRDNISPKRESMFSQKQYTQTFGNDFQPNLSCLDLLFNTGNEAYSYLISR